MVYIHIYLFYLVTCNTNTYLVFMLARSLELKELYNLLFWLRLRPVVEPRLFYEGYCWDKRKSLNVHPLYHPNTYLTSVLYCAWIPLYLRRKPLTPWFPPSTQGSSHPQRQGNQVSSLHVTGPTEQILLVVHPHFFLYNRHLLIFFPLLSVCRKVDPSTRRWIKFILSWLWAPIWKWEKNLNFAF